MNSYPKLNFPPIKLRARDSRGRTVVFDGAFGTILQRAVGDPGPVPERLNLSRPDVIAGIHRAYAEAGADVITADTFGANRFKTGNSCAAHPRYSSRRRDITPFWGRGT